MPAKFTGIFECDGCEKKCRRHMTLSFPDGIGPQIASTSAISMLSFLADNAEYLEAADMHMMNGRVVRLAKSGCLIDGMPATLAEANELIGSERRATCGVKNEEEKEVVRGPVDGYSGGTNSRLIH